MKCEECGSIVSEDDLFCGVCGAVVDVPPPVAAAGDSAPAALGEPGASVAQAVATSDSRANAAFVLGIISIGLAVVSCIPFISFASCLGPVIGIVAVVLGAIARRDIDIQGGLEGDRKKAQQGMIMGIVGFLLYMVMIVLGVVLGVGFSILGEM